MSSAAKREEVPAQAGAFVPCPWCPGFDPRDPRHAGVSHGICEACRAKLSAELDGQEGAR